MKKSKLQIMNSLGYVCLLCHKKRDYKCNDKLFLHLHYFHRSESEELLWKYDIDKELLQEMKPWAKNSLKRYGMLRSIMIDNWSKDKTIEFDYMKELMTLNPEQETKYRRKNAKKFENEIETCYKHLEEMMNKEHYNLEEEEGDCAESETSEISR
ncbi:hypothetical protein FGO68_gene6536 [Halteria grandinella]|uniref:Uncharacterized protein n=1 Tax=Halteria grandinella TaxID=5974 RepID=A0A8J8NIC4_HALGN|nr:hypothetical protein FGO68_gene6536 [Halteria grandinella]